MSNEMRVQVPDAIIQGHLEAAVASALGGPGKEDLIRSIISIIVNQKVRSSRGYAEVPLWKNMFVDLVEAKVREILRAEVEKRSDAIAAALRKQISAKKFADSMADALVNTIKDSAWNTSVAFQPKSTN